MHAIGFASHSMESARSLIERNAVALGAMGWSVAIAVLVFIVFGWSLWNLWILY